jgi:predicted NBD/HSP70 family sugar kinase
VAQAVSALLDDGLIVEREPGAGGARRRGRPATLLSPARPAGHVLGIDIGQAHVSAAVADTAGEVLAEGRSTPEDGHDAWAQGNDSALDAAERLARQLLGQAGIPLTQLLAIAASLPHPPLPHPPLPHPPLPHPPVPHPPLPHPPVPHPRRAPGGRPSGPAQAPEGRPSGPAQQDLTARFGQPVQVMNDTDLGALGEFRFGAAHGRGDVLYVQASDGVRAGLVLDGRVYRGVTGMAGEIGHTRLPDASEWCRCGSRGCLETVVSLIPLHCRLARIGLAPAPGDAAWSLPELREHPAAARVITEAGRALGRVLADLCNCLNPGAVILGGEIGAAGPPLLAGVRESIDSYARPAIAAAVQVRTAGLGPRSELLGAVALAIQRTAAHG